MVVAKGKLGDHDIEAEVVNPGDWWGRLWLIEIGCGYSSVYYAVEAHTQQDALDEFADSKHAHHITIDIELEGGDYGFEVNPGDIIGGVEITTKGTMTLKGEMTTESVSEPALLGNAGTPCDLDHVSVYGPIGRFVYFDADDEHCDHIPPELYGERES